MAAWIGDSLTPRPASSLENSSKKSSSLAYAIDNMESGQQLLLLDADAAVRATCDYVA